MSQLPKGWVETTLDKIATWGSGGTPKRNEPSYYGGDIPWVKTGDLGPKLLKEASEYISRLGLDNSSAKLFPKGSVAIAMYGATIGKTSILDFETSTNQACAVGSPIDGLTSTEFLYYFLASEKQNFIKKGKGGAQPNISQQLIKAHNVMLPPLAEQTRIVEKLDEVLAQVDTIKARLDGIPASLKRFRQSVLAAAVSGKLTEEWRKNNSGQQIKQLLYEIETQREKLKAAKLLKRSFGKHETVDPQSNELPDGWEWVCFDQISDNENNALKAGPFGSALKKSDCTDHGYRVYGQEQVIAGDETLVSYYINEEKYQQLEACSVKSGDILISLVGTIGKVLILSDKVESGIINPRLVKLSLNSEIQRKYIKAYLDSPLAWHFFNGFSHGGTMDILNLGILRKLPIPLPPVEEQKEIVRLVDQYFAFADTIEAQVKKAQARVDKLTQSILAKAFRGELVPQDPNDEPADKLLERIALARKEAEVLAKAAKKAAKK
ncbi:type I restriction endonuclease subunit S [Vibrio cidicii]|uniref:Type I restriction endonuclease subunit S n=1 Tax=Vibrio cidicii TaxID=1763883 RepID=A0A151KV88_9VIBR|nr:restriction endonuclease subunit S [Vibrio cidicii]KYN85120.1 type I restriction endonuclease subunit S [Vibrio cidicii]